MTKEPNEPAVNLAVAELRNMVLDADPGTFLGSEDSLRAQFGCSRNTLRQAARLLERDGFILVRRGINGGYFGARPTVASVESFVGAYLETLNLDPEDVTVVASVLWVEVLRKATMRHSEASRELAAKYLAKLKKIKATATFAEVRDFEQETRKAIFQFAQCAYVEFIFNINSAFSTRGFPRRENMDDTPEHLAFVRAWRDAKVMELTSIGEGDVALGVMAAHHIRDIWHKRLWHFREPNKS